MQPTHRVFFIGRKIGQNARDRVGGIGIAGLAQGNWHQSSQRLIGKLCMTLEIADQCARTSGEHYVIERTVKARLQRQKSINRKRLCNETAGTVDAGIQHRAGCHRPGQQSFPYASTPYRPQLLPGAPVKITRNIELRFKAIHHRRR